MRVVCDESHHLELTYMQSVQETHMSLLPYSTCYVSFSLCKGLLMAFVGKHKDYLFLHEEN